MAKGNSTGGQLEAAAGAAGPHATEAFKLLSNETRLAILLALWEASEPQAPDDAVSFTELRTRVGVRQGTQFNYHLDKLVGQFVRKTDDGYELRSPGRMIVRSIIAGTGIEDPTLEPTEIDAPCKYCGATTAITYEGGYVHQVCTECDGASSPDDDHPTGTLVAWTFEPTGLSSRTAAEVFAASTIKTYGRIVMRFEGLCPDCSGPVEWSFDVCDDHDVPADDVCPNCERKEAVLARETCTICKSAGWGSPGIKLLFHPAVVSFFYDHGVEIGFTGSTDFTDVLRTLELVEAFEEGVVSTDPLRIRVSITQDDDELHLTLDEGMNVVAVSEEI